MATCPGRPRAAAMAIPRLSLTFFWPMNSTSRWGRRDSSTTLSSARASGVVISADGYVLTTYRAVDGAEDVKVALGEPRKEYPAKITGRDARSDLALLKIDATGLDRKSVV